jgi:hemolysin activation/secretion protein
LFDVRAPAVNVGQFPTGSGDVPAYLRCSWFMDYGRVYLLDRSDLSRNHLSEWGTGIDLLVTAGEHFNARLAVAWSLAGGASSSNPNDTLVLSRPGSAQAYFSIGFQF